MGQRGTMGHFVHFVSFRLEYFSNQTELWNEVWYTLGHSSHVHTTKHSSFNLYVFSEKQLQTENLFSYARSKLYSCLHLIMFQHAWNLFSRSQNKVSCLLLRTRRKFRHAFIDPHNSITIYMHVFCGAQWASLTICHNLSLMNMNIPHKVLITSDDVCLKYILSFLSVNRLIWRQISNTVIQ